MRAETKIVSNGMVLQRNEDFVLTGSGADGTVVTVEFGGMVRESVCADGRYSVCFESIQAGGPYTLRTRGAKEDVYVTDVLVGDVYFMTGQSNMELDVNWIYHSFRKEIDEFECDSIRQFKVPIDYDFNQPLEDVADGIWVKADAEHRKTFGAIGFFLAKKLYRENGIPVGLIQTAVPGCPIESFLTKENVEKYQKTELDPVCFDKAAMKAQLEQEQADWDARVQRLLERDAKLEHSYHHTVIPLLREEPEDSQAGVYTFRKNFDLREAPQEDAILKLGLLIDADDTYVNGVLVGQTGYQYPPRRYIVPKEILRQGENRIEVKLVVTNGVCRFWEKQEYMLTSGDEVIDLTGVWKFSRGYFEKEPFFKKTFFEYLPYGVYNAMIAPLMDYPVCGLLFYQGESNTGAPEGYYEKFRTMIGQFRSEYGKKELPVYYVQLAYYEDPADPERTGWQSIRQQQAQAEDVPYAYMIVSGDVGSATDLHPQNKKAIGERIAALVQS